MTVSEYFDSLENTEDEQKLIGQLLEIKDAIEKAASLPFLGKVMRALIALGESESIEAFRQTNHYATIKDWNVIAHDFNSTPNFTMYPSDAQLAKFFKILAVIIGGVLLLALCKKCCCRR